MELSGWLLARVASRRTLALPGVSTDAPHELFMQHWFHAGILQLRVPAKHFIVSDVGSRRCQRAH